jgi:hypothetical protein
MENTQPRVRFRKDGSHALILLRSGQRLSELAPWNNAELNMTTPPEMRDLAQRLLTYEVDVGKTSEPVESTTLRVYEKLRQSLGEFAGTAAFHSLASRALAMARSEIPSLRAAQVSADGALRGLGQGLGQGLSEFGPQFDIDKDRAAEHRAGDEGVAVIARLLGLLLIFLGEPITLRLLRNAWPGAAFDDRSSEKGK